MTTARTLPYETPRTYRETYFRDILRPIPSDHELHHDFFTDADLLQHQAVPGLIAMDDDVALAVMDGAYRLRDVIQVTTDRPIIAAMIRRAIAPTTTPSWHRETLEMRLDNLCSVPEEERWPDARWPTDEAFKEAREFIKRLPYSLDRLPYISLANDGEVNFGWKSDTLHIDLGFYGTGTYSYYATDEDGSEWLEDDIPIWSPLPEELFSLLSS